MDDQPVKDFYKYELQVVKHHSEEYKQKTWHQHVIPEDVYYASGIITDWKQNRHDRLDRLLKKNKESMKKSLLPDFGIDFLSYDEINNSYHLGQVKCYEQARVTTKSCATFTMQVFVLRHKKGYLYTSKDNLERNFREMIEQSSGRIEHVVLPFNGRVITTELTCLDTEINFILRDYQEQAIQAVLESQERKNLLKLITGSGKTLVAAHIVQRMKYKYIVCVAPLLCSTDQLQQRITPFTQGHKVITISTYGTTDVSEIDQQISEKDEPFVIFTTFKSFVEVVSKLTNLDFETTFLLVDEVHNVLNNDPLCELANKFKNSLYLSATVPEELNEVLEFQEVFSYNIRTAINEGVCVDYELYLPYLEPKEENTETTIFLSKAHFLATGLLRTGKRRCIVYLNTIAECEVFATTIEQVFEEYHGIRIETFAMNCETSKTNREAILSRFSEPNYDTIKIIVNVRILNEAIDIVACDSVFVTQIGEHTNDITIVQRLGRALRKDPHNPTKTAAMFIWCEDWDQCVSGLQLLKNEDVEFHKKIHVASSDYDKTEVCRQAVEEQTEEALRFIRVQCLTLGELWEVRRLHWNEQFVKLGRSPSCHSKNAAEKRAGQWQVNQRRLFKKGTLLPERIDELNKTTGWEWEQGIRTFQESKSDWSEQFVILGRAPSPASKNADEKRAGLWQRTQRGLFKKGTLPKERINALNKTAGWEWEQGGIRTFQESKSDWSEQFVKLGRTPSPHSKNADEKRAGLWQMTQRGYFKKGTLPKERINALNKTAGWEWAQGIRTFQESKSDWSEQFVILGRTPTHHSKNAAEKRAALWQKTQRASFKKGTLPTERIDELNNTEGWEWEQGVRTFQESKSDWSEQFVILGKAPSRYSKNAAEKKAGIWQNTQRRLFKKGTLLPERIDALTNTEGWEWGR
jgi:superfamily II DNA or RNA helicase